MSVINQMLKDLEKRNNDGAQPNVIHVPSSNDNVSKSVVAIAIVISIIITLLVVYLFTLRQENHTLKTQTTSDAQSTVTQKNQPTAKIESVINNSASEVKASVENQTYTAHLENENSDTKGNTEHELPTPTVYSTEKVQSNENVEIIADLSNAPQPNAPQQKPHTESKAKATTATNTIKNSEAAVPSSLSISRKQLSPEELVAQKMKKAEKAMMDKDLLLAEELFADVLLLIPKNITARKQLAALWFGRHQYQDALNLLSRGIEINPEDTEFRLMQARIYLAQQQNEAAFLVLNSLHNAPDIEYQSLLATTAQALNKFADAEKAYTLLITMQPQQSRWYLGLAVSLDKQSQFDKAIAAYKRAVSLGGLSNNTMQFAVQRLKDLGE